MNDTTRTTTEGKANDGVNLGEKKTINHATGKKRA